MIIGEYLNDFLINLRQGYVTRNIVAHYLVSVLLATPIDKPLDHLRVSPYRVRGQGFLCVRIGSFRDVGDELPNMDRS